MGYRASEALVATGVEPSANVSAICEAHDLARQQVYEEKSRIKAALEVVTVAGRGRPVRQGATVSSGGDTEARSLAVSELRVGVLEFRLANPGAVVVNATGRITYSAAFKRFALDAADAFIGTDEDFCRASRVPFSTLITWRKLDAEEPIMPLLHLKPVASCGRPLPPYVWCCSSHKDRAFYN